MAASILTPLTGDHQARHDADGSRVRRALAADPALAGRVSCDDRGTVVLTGPADGPSPASRKERRRWELHVRLRLAAELGGVPPAALEIRWAEPAECI